MADLGNEQRLIGKLAGRNLGVPPVLLPPFCPDEASLPGHASSRAAIALLVKAPVASLGWIIRPVPALAEAPTHTRTGDALFPGYPPLPALPAFILGYAGDRAEAVCAELRKAGSGDFPVTVWYHATLSVSVEYDPPRSYRICHETGPAAWTRVRPGASSLSRVPRS